MDELYEYEDKAKKMSGGKLSATELDRIQKLTKVVKTIDEIEMYEEFGEDGESSFARGRRNVRRDSRGRYSRRAYGYDGKYPDGDEAYRDGSSYRGGSSYAGAKEHLIKKMEEALEMAEDPKERRAIEKCLDEMED